MDAARDGDGRARAGGGRLLFHAGSFVALERALWRELRARREAEPLAPILVLVPTNLLRRHLTAAVADLGGAINVHFLTLLDLARKLGEPALAAEGRAPLPPLGGPLLARRASLATPGGYFASLASSPSPGFHRALLATLDDFKEAGHAPDGLERALGRLAREEGGLVRKLRDLHALWRACEGRLAELRLYDTADLFAAAAGAAPRDPWLSAVAGILVYGFYDLTEIQRRLVAACLAGKPACALVPYMRDAEAFAYARPTFDWFLAQGFAPAAEPEPPLPPELDALARRLFEPLAGLPPPTQGDAGRGTRDEGSAERESVERRALSVERKAQEAKDAPPPDAPRSTLHAPPPDAPHSTPDAPRPTAPAGDDAGHSAFGVDSSFVIRHSSFLRILSAPDEVREVRIIVRSALAAARGGTPLTRVGVLLRQTGLYAPLFAEECEAGGLDAYHHDPPPLSTSRAGRSVLLLLRLVGSDFSRADVMDFVTQADIPFEAFVPAPSSASMGVEEVSPADWDLLSIEAGIVKGRDNWGRQLARLRRRLEAEAEDEDARETREQIARLDALTAFIGAFLGALARVPAEGTWTELVEGMLGVFRRFVRASAERAEVEEAVAGLRSLDATGERADARALAALAREALEARRPRRAAFGSNGPVIADLMEARGLPFEVVCLPGLVEKGFPAPPREDPLLSDRERARLAKLGLRVPLKGERAKEERLLFRLGLAGGSREVILTYPRLEPATARERVPSHFLLRVAEALTGRRFDYAHLDGFPGHERVAAPAFAPGRPEDAWREAEYDLAAVLDGVSRRDAEAFSYLARLSPTFAAAHRAEERRWSERRFTEYDGVLHSKAALGALAQRLGPMPWHLAPTELELYAQCPFRYFLVKVLGIREIEEPETILRLSGLDRGSLVHDILHRTLARAKREGWLPLRLEHEDRVLDEARQGFARFEEEGATGFAALWALERGALELDLRRFILDEASEAAGYVPAFFEVCFGRAAHGHPGELGSEEGLLVALGGLGSVRVVGRIDRIDLSPASRQARVVDYKTGRRPSDLKPDALLGGTALQLPLYLQAAAALLGDQARVEEALYRFVTSRGGYAAVGFSRAAFERRREEILAVLGTIAQGIAEGRFFPSPDDARCRGCEHRAVCGVGTRALAERKADDPAARPFRQMREVP